jgi:hypothetical protein
MTVPDALFAGVAIGTRERAMAARHGTATVLSDHRF